MPIFHLDYEGKIQPPDPKPEFLHRNPDPSQALRISASRGIQSQRMLRNSHTLKPDNAAKFPHPETRECCEIPTPRNSKPLFQTVVPNRWDSRLLLKVPHADNAAGLVQEFPPNSLEKPQKIPTPQNPPKNPLSNPRAPRRERCRPAEKVSRVESFPVGAGQGRDHVCPVCPHPQSRRRGGRSSWTTGRGEVMSLSF